MRVSRIIALRFVAALLVGIVANSAIAQEPNSSRVKVLAQAANRNAKQRCTAFHNKWDKLLKTTGTAAQFRGMAKDVVSLNEKVAQGVRLLNQSANPIEARMRASLRRNVIDERKWLKAMTESVDELQAELIRETVELYVKAGFDRKRVEKHFKPLKVDCRVWAPVFDRVIVKAKALAVTDWGRVAAIHAGSGLVTDAVFEASRRRGNWTTQKGGWFDVLSRFAAQTLVEGIAERATNPTDRVARELQVEYAKARSTLLNGKHGLKWLATHLTQLHVDVRNRDLVATTKGGK